ncbi:MULTISPECIES: allantoinase AllB [Streptomyces]|uniref:allantoinase n=1 Tax=Streptomyces chartreusis NRRL 3882 TaxID=1079985 RepID=A0A2N9B428_STRCX|nr:allantoinase AllB [Streptomyces chartreusis]MYS88873.1 allantoinase AllB [Streptomyces sp. SID5464]SOR78053.1 Allantoinase [Streptomyces chartreusis NRRL 3882]
MSDAELVLRSTRVITPEGTRAASVAVAAGTITAVLPYDAPVPEAARLEDLGDHVLLPGLVDTHVHVNDPGRTEWEGFWTATRAAAAGGITTLVDMPLNSLPPTTTVAHLRTKQQVAADKAHIDVGFWGGALPDNVKDLRPLHEAGVFGFKAFLSPSGVDEFPHLERDPLARAMAEIAAFDGLLIVHAEDPHRLASAPQRPGPRYADFLASRPRDAEDTAIAQLIREAKALDARVHVLHLSSSDALPMIAQARAEGVRITVETCPHYLTLTAEEVPDGASEFKCCPPIREAANQDLLWQALADGTIDCVVTDHSPSTADLKTDDFATAWGGISGLQLSLPAVWTEARERGHGLEDVVRWMSTRTSELVGLDDRKGAIAAGRDADFAVLAPDETFTVDPAALQHRNHVTAYAGRTLYGVVKSTWLRGQRIVADGEFTEPKGRLLTRTN